MGRCCAVLAVAVAVLYSAAEETSGEVSQCFVGSIRKWEDNTSLAIALCSALPGD